MFASRPFTLITGSGRPPRGLHPVHPDLGEMAALTSMSYRTQGHCHPTVQAMVLNDARAGLPSHGVFCLRSVVRGGPRGAQGTSPCLAPLAVRSAPCPETGIREELGRQQGVKSVNKGSRGAGRGHSHAGRGPADGNHHCPSHEAGAVFTSITRQVGRDFWGGWH